MERYKDLNTQLKLAKVFKAVISAGLVAPVFVSVSACEKDKPVIEEIEQETISTTQETTPEITASVEITIQETTETTTEIKEFEALMIKNRLVFSASAEQFGKTHPEAIFDFKPGAPLPLWYLCDWDTKDGKAYSYVVSAVVAGEFKKEIGETGKEELLLPVAFQDPTTKKFLVRDITFGDTEFFETVEKGAWNNDLSGGIATVFLNDYTFIGMESYETRSAHFEEIKTNLRVGDQIAFSPFCIWGVLS